MASKMKIFGAVILVLGGAVGAAFFTGVIQKPGFGLQDRGDWKSVGSEKVSITTTGYVYNPNPFALNLSTLDVAYRLKMNGVALAEGGKKGLYIGAKQNNTVKIDTALQPEKVPKWWAQHLSGGEKSRLEVPFNAELKVLSYPVKLSGYSYTDTISTDIESKLDSAFSKVEGTYTRSMGPAGITETTIEIVDASAKWGRVTPGTTEMLVDLKVKNRNSYPIPVPQMTGSLVMNSVKIAEWDANDVSATRAPADGTIAPGETENIRLKARMNNTRIDDWFVSHARKGEQTDATINAKMFFQIEGSRFMIPSGQGMSCDFSFRTAILVEDQEPGGTFHGCSGLGGRDSSSSGGNQSNSGDDNSSNTDDPIGGLLG